MTDIDKEIIDELKSKGVVGKLKESYEIDLETLQLWGGETTLHLDYITKEIPQILNTFEELRHISFSTNLVAINSIEYIVDLIKAINNNIDDREFELGVQVSIDGPPFITDNTRVDYDGKGVTDKILENNKELMNKMTEIELKSNFKVTHTFKSTVEINYIRQMVEDKEKILEYWKYFNKTAEDYNSMRESLPNSYSFIPESACPSIVVPGDYTSDDGRVFAEFITEHANLAIKNKRENILSMNIPVPYVGRLVSILNQGRQIRLQNRGLACGAGGHGYALGLNDDVHMCHRSYFYNQEEYTNMLKLDMNKYEVGRLGMFIDNFIVSKDDEKDFLRHRYVLNGVRDFAQLAVSHIQATIRELVEVEQAHINYKDSPELMHLASIFIKKSCFCIAENVLTTGSLHLLPIGLVKIWTNGAVQAIYNSYKRLREEGFYG